MENEWMNELYCELKDVVGRVASTAKHPKDCEQEIWVAVIQARHKGLVSKKLCARIGVCVRANPVSYTHLTLPTKRIV